MVRWLARLACAALIVVGLAALPRLLSRSDGYQRLTTMRAQVDDLDQGNNALRDENRALRREVVRLRSDLDAIEAVARDELGLVSPGDIVIQIERGPQRGAAP